MGGATECRIAFVLFIAARHVKTCRVVPWCSTAPFDEADVPPLGLEGREDEGRRVILDGLLSRGDRHAGLTRLANHTLGTAQSGRRRFGAARLAAEARYSGTAHKPSSFQRVLSHSVSGRYRARGVLKVAPPESRRFLSVGNRATRTLR